MTSKHGGYALTVVIGCMAVAGCGKSLDRSNPKAVAVTAAHTPASLSLNDDLPRGFTATAFAPGRYVTVIGRLLNGTHALQVLSEDSTAMLSIELLADGTAAATRGWRFLTRADGPEIHTEENYREQQGYRGSYTVRGSVANVVLNTDNTVCSHIFEGAYALDRAASLELRCVLATPPGTLGEVMASVLLCRSAKDDVLELQTQIVESVADGQWLVLGSGNGLQISVTGRPFSARGGEPMSGVVTAASAPIALDAWEHRLATL